MAAIANSVLNGKVTQEKINPFEEKGAEGLNAFYGHVSEPYLSKLEWPNAYQVYDEMRRRDPTLRSILNAVKMLARQSEWKAEAPSDKPADREAAEFLQSCIEDMSHTVDDFIDDVFTFMPFGWASFETVYKRRDGQDGMVNDGRIGWDKFAFRRQSSFSRWQFDTNGGFDGWHQMPAPTYREIYLPSNKLLHFVAERDGNNPEGLSLFESAYESFHFVTNLQIIGGIGWQRAFVGLPVFKFEENRPSTEDLARVKAVGEGLAVDEKQYVSIPAGIDFDLMSVQNSGASSLLDTIRFYRLMMTQMVMADFIFLGSGDVGSYSLAQDKSELFLMAVNGYLDKIAATWNREGAKRLFEYNEFPGVTQLPKITHTQVRKPKLNELGDFIQKISSFITVSDEDEIWLRNQTGMPEKVEVKEEDEATEEQAPSSDDIAPETGQGEKEADDAEASSSFCDYPECSGLSWAGYP